MVWACDEKSGALHRKEGNENESTSIQGTWKRGSPNRRWLDKLKDDIKEKGQSAEEVYDRATWRRIHRPQIKVGIR